MSDRVFGHHKDLVRFLARQVRPLSPREKERIVANIEKARRLCRLLNPMPSETSGLSFLRQSLPRTVYQLIRREPFLWPKSIFFVRSRDIRNLEFLEKLTEAIEICMTVPAETWEPFKRIALGQPTVFDNIIRRIAVYRRKMHAAGCARS